MTRSVPLSELHHATRDGILTIAVILVTTTNVLELAIERYFLVHNVRRSNLILRFCAIFYLFAK